MSITGCWTVTPVFKPKTTRPASEEQVISPFRTSITWEVFILHRCRQLQLHQAQQSHYVSNVPSFADHEIIFPCKEDGGLAPFHRERLSLAMDLRPIVFCVFFNFLLYLQSSAWKNLYQYRPAPPQSILSTFSW